MLIQNTWIFKPELEFYEDHLSYGLVHVLEWIKRKERKKLCQPSSCLISFCKMKQIKLLIHHKKAVRVFNSQPIAYALLFRMNMICCYLIMRFSTKSSRLSSGKGKQWKETIFFNLMITAVKLYLILSACRFACISYISFLWFKFWHHKMTLKFPFITLQVE